MQMRVQSWVGKIPWRRRWHPTPIFLPGKFHGGRSLPGYSPWGHKELDTTKWLNNNSKEYIRFVMKIKWADVWEAIKVPSILATVVVVLLPICHNITCSSSHQWPISPSPSCALQLASPLPSYMLPLGALLCSGMSASPSRQADIPWYMHLKWT